MTTIYIDDKPYEVREGSNLLHACLGLGFDIPYFCWHPALHSVGSCRLCAVKQFKDEKDSRGRIVMSCMTPVSENMRISVDDEEVRRFRAGIIELLMMNHPHDCPVCDEGGECHLQDMTLMTGHVYRRFRYKKRTFRNQYLGPFLNHEMNRCIHCYRCVRFYRDYAGGRDLDAFASHHFVYFGRLEDGVLENRFSGNLAEVCPTGVFTDKTLKRHYTRKWDLQTAPSLCVHCSLGCNTIPGERYGTLRRILNRYHSEINGYFLCDRGRFGYEFVNHHSRIRKPVTGKKGRGGNGSIPVTEGDEVLSSLAPLFHYGAGVIGIGSPRSSLEANYALRTLVGPERFYSGMSGKEAALVNAITEIYAAGPAPSATLRDVASSDAVLILGEDVMNTAPMLGLALRQSIRNQPMEAVKKMGIHEWNDAAVRIIMQDEKGPLFIASPQATLLDRLSRETYNAAPDDIARLGFAVAHDVDHTAPAVHDLPRDARALARTIAEELKNAERPLVVTGTGCGSMSIIKAAANVAWALCRAGRPASLCFTAPECNSLGMGLMGAGSLEKAFEAVEQGGIETAVILENDLYRRADEKVVDKFLESIQNIIVIDAVETRTTGRADTVLPSASFAESQGTMVNNEGRAQRFFRVFVPDGTIKENWEWVRGMLSASGRAGGESWKTLNDITAALAEEMDRFAPVPGITPAEGFPVTGQKVPRQSHRYSGRTAMSADRTVHEPRPPDDPGSPLSFSMEIH